MPLWAKVDVDMPTDAKLLGQPVATRHLWTCLICLAKKQDDGGAVRGYDCALLAGAFNLPRKGVASALTHYQLHRMVELDADGTIRLLHFVERQGIGVYEQREQWRQRKDKERAVTRESPVTLAIESPVNHAPRAEIEVEGEKKKSRAVKSKATATDLPAPASPAPTNAVWEAYSEAIEKRYGVKPADGSPARGKITQFLRGVPKDEAPHIAAFFVSHNGALYVNAKHPLELLVRDSQKFRTEWLNGQPVTGTDARQLERSDSNLRSWEKHLVPEVKSAS